jgi:uncharacterized membrane protein (UPF0136 family)
MSAPRKTLSEVEQDAAAAGGERRDGLRLILTGRALFLFAGAPRDLQHRDGSGSTTVLAFKVWTPRGGELWCEVRSPEHISLVAGLVEGSQIELAGQLVTKARRLGGQFVTARVFELARVG